jgi:hypothetical protein
LQQCDFDAATLLWLKDESPKKFLTLDQKLATGLRTICHGEFKRRVNQTEANQLTQCAKLLSGRQILWMILQSLKTGDSMERQYNVVDLMNLNWKGDDDIETFRNNWDEIIDGMGEQMTEKTKCDILIA